MKRRVPGASALGRIATVFGQKRTLVDDPPEPLFHSGDRGSIPVGTLL